MGRILFITGGVRSGKSKFAEDMLRDEQNVLFVATAIAFDPEMKDRIERHRSRRKSSWITVEAYRNLAELIMNKLSGVEYIILDCLTVMISNLMVLDSGIDWDKANIDQVNDMDSTVRDEVARFIDLCHAFTGTSIIVSNELGMGVVPPTPLGRYFRDIAGRINQIVAAEADEVYFLVSGIPMQIKRRA